MSKALKPVDATVADAHTLRGTTLGATYLSFEMLKVSKPVDVTDGN